jgi:hypothetical protein
MSPHFEAVDHRSDSSTKVEEHLDQRQVILIVKIPSLHLARASPSAPRNPRHYGRF